MTSSPHRSAFPKLAPWRLALLALTACSDLPSVRQGVCGNGALDPGEDCDFLEGIGIPAGQACGPPTDRQTACHWTCGRDVACPPAWGCGVDGLCRYADGQFDSETPITPALYSGAAVGDLDGDAWPDVAGTSDRREVEILYGGPEPYTAIDRIPSSASGAFDVADLDLDGVLDVATAFRGGVLVGLGQADRTLSTVLYPTLELAEPRKRLFALDVGGLGATVQIEDAGGEIDVSLAGGPSTGATRLPVALDDLVVPPAAADVDGDGDQDLLLTAAGSPAVYLLRTDPALVPPFVVTSLAVDPSLAGPASGGAGHRRSLHLVNVDGDGRLDVLAAFLDQGGLERPTVARGLGGGAFATLAPEARFAAGTTTGCGGAPALAQVLDAADLDHDGVADYVMPGGVYLTRTDGAPHLCLALRAADLPGWSDAVIADLNRDGDPDVVSASPTETLDVLLGDGRGAFSERTIAVAAPGDFLRAGDFDGDRVDDVAFVEAGAVSILFGTVQGTPVPAAMGTVGVVSSFQPLRIADATGEVDAVTDLLVQWEADGGNDLVGYLFGTTSRRMIAPLPVAESVLHIAAGLFDADSLPDLMVVGATGADPPTFRLIRGDGTGGLETLGGGVPACSDPMPGVETTLAHGDLLGGPEEELVTLARLSGQDPPIHIIAPAVDAAGGLTFSCQDVAPPASWTFERVQVADLDGDGRLDLLTIVTDGAGAAIVAFWNEGEGIFGTSEPIPITVPLGRPALTSVQADLDPARELAYVGEDSTLYLVQADERTYEAPVGVLEVIRDVLWLAAADVDGDGLEDLVGSGVDGTFFLQAVAHLGGGLP